MKQNRFKTTNMETSMIIPFASKKGHQIKPYGGDKMTRSEPHIISAASIRAAEKETAKKAVRRKKELEDPAREVYVRPDEFDGV